MDKSRKNTAGSAIGKSRRRKTETTSNSGAWVDHTTAVELLMGEPAPSAMAQAQA